MTSTSQNLALKVEELERLIQRVEPAAFLVPPRLLRRVIKNDRKIGGVGLFVPHSKGYVIDRAALQAQITPAELGRTPNDELPPHVYLMIRPDPARLARGTHEQALLKYWRILFHLRIDLHLKQKMERGSLAPVQVRQRIRRLGCTEFAEIAAVLRQENYLLPPESSEAIYGEFVAVYLTLRRFDRALVPHFFPALRDLAAVDALVAEDVDAEAIYTATRLPGAPEPASLPPLISEADEPLEMTTDNPPTAAVVSRSEGNEESVEDARDRALRARAEKMDARGNNVRAAILRTQAAQRNNSPIDPDGAELRQLAGRLKKALELDDDAESWREALLPLLAPAARGYWNQEARLLYDLQSVCVSSERGIYAVDVVGWIVSLGKLSIKRRLPGHEQVVQVRDPRLALGRLRLARVSDAQRQRLSQLLIHAVEHRESLIRERFRPLLAGALDEVGLKPDSVAVEVGRAKLIEELLDCVVESGHFNMSDLRDAISRNQLKLPDLTGPKKLATGDPLIRLNRKLAVDLDGVYRRGEIYMRMLHRLSSCAFGTALGRLAVLFLILPFGLAFFVMITPGIILEEGEELAGWIGPLLGIMEKPPKVHHQAGQHHESRHAFPLPNFWGVAVLGVFFLGMFHVERFRGRVFEVLGKLGHILHRVFVAGPVWLVHLPAVQAILHSRFWGLFRRLLFWPGLLAAAGGSIAAWDGLETSVVVGIAGACLAIGIVLLNTPLGREVEETVTDWILRFWMWLSIDLVPGLLHLIMDVSRRCLDAVERGLYTVDEWLLFRGGESQSSIVAKAILGLFWFLATYVIRFVINLLVEPQLNPIKHFPVVTVSHKVCLPMTPVLRDFLVAKFGLDGPRALALAGGIISGIPGIFGFMVWELKENWKLYASNRAGNLKQVLIGSHGETMLRLLHPGFHSGTIPKLYKNLRRAERRGQQRTVRKVLSALRHVEESVAHFVERDFVALLEQPKSGFGLAVELEHVRLATNRVLVELRCKALDEKPLVFSIDCQEGWLLAGVIEAGWLPKLSAGQRQTLGAALAGLYKMAGVHLTREQIDESLPATTFAFDLGDAGLMVWTGVEGAHEAVYDLSAGPEVAPRSLNGDLPAGMPVLNTSRLLFGDVPLPWHEWVRTWENDHADGELRRRAAVLLPAAKG